MMEPSVGFIGLGNIGTRVAQRLIDHGYSLVVNDTRSEPVESLRERGAEAATSPQAVARRVSIIMICLPNPDAVEQVVFGTKGLIKGLAEGTILIDLSTSGVETEQKIARELGAQGVAVLDAPVSGGIEGAESGTLSMMVAGRRDAFEKCLRLLQVCGNDIFHVSEEPGLGQALKLVNNLIVATNFAVTSEALVLASKIGLDPKVVIDVINASSGRSFVSEHRFPGVVASAPAGVFSAPQLLHKDLTLTNWLAKHHEVPLLIGRIVELIYELALNGEAADNGTDIIEFYKEIARVSKV